MRRVFFGALLFSVVFLLDLIHCTTASHYFPLIFFFLSLYLIGI